MRPGQQNKRGRGRNNNNNNNNGGGGGNNHNRKGQNPLTRTYDSSGPDVKIRGTAQHIAEKYAALARDAQSAGDRVMAENYLQHAEHYNRIIAAAQAQLQERFQREDRQSYEGADLDGADGDDDQDQGYDEAPAVIQPPRQQQPRSFQPRERENRDQQPRENRGEGRADRQPREDRGDAQTRETQPRDAQPRETQARDTQPARDVPVREPQPTPAASHAPEPVDDGTGPQPVIEGTPVEVSIEEEVSGSAARAPSRRRGTPRPRRPRRTDAAGEEGAAGDQPETPALAASE